MRAGSYASVAQSVERLIRKYLLNQSKSAQIAPKRANLTLLSPFSKIPVKKV